MIGRASIRLVVPLLTLTPVLADAQVTAELDALWADVVQAVATGDTELYLSTYHPDAIFVSVRRGITRTVVDDVEANRSAWNDTSEGRARRSVEFRFTQRLHNPTSAHEVGMFRYASTEADGSSRAVIIHFEAALVKKEGVWLQLLELQTADATQAEWDAAR